MARRRRSIFPQQSTVQPYSGNAYAAAKQTDITASWSTMTYTADDFVRTSSQPLIARAREQVANNDYARKGLLMFRNNVVGPKGLKIKPDARMQNWDEDRKANEALRKWWHNEFSKARYCDFQRQLNLVQICNLLINHLYTDGELLLRFRSRTDENGTRPSLRVLDPSRLDFTYSDHRIPRRTLGDRKVRFGIEYDSDWIPVTYWFRDDEGEVMANGNRLVGVPADEILHRFIPIMADQKRGLSMLGTSLLRMRMLDKFEDAAVVKAATAASDHGYINMASPEGYTGDDEDEDGNPVYYGEANAFRVMPEGTEIHQVNYDWPNGEYPAFMKGMLRAVAGSLGVSYSGLASDFESVNFSAAKMDRAEERDLWVCLQEWFGEMVLEPVYQRVLFDALSRGIPVSPQTNLNPLLVDKYRKVSFEGRRWVGIENEKDAKADQTNLANGTTSRRRIAERRGDDFDQIVRELAEEKALGFANPAESAQNPQASDPAEQGESEDDEEGNGREDDS